MLTLEKLQKQDSDRFAHLVTFKNTQGFNGKNIRINLPSRFNDIRYMDKHPSIKFDEDMLTIKFQYTPNDKTSIECLSDQWNKTELCLMTEALRYYGIKDNEYIQE